MSQCLRRRYDVTGIKWRDAWRRPRRHTGQWRHNAACWPRRLPCTRHDTVNLFAPSQLLASLIYCTKPNNRKVIKRTTKIKLTSPFLVNHLYRICDNQTETVIFLDDCYCQLTWLYWQRYDTIRGAILTCAQKLTWVYSTEPTTKRGKQKNKKS